MWADWIISVRRFLLLLIMWLWVISHNPQNVGGNERIRYCGTPLKYSFSELQQQKSVTMVELAEKGNMKVTQLLLTPLREVRYLKDTF